jgi:PIN domain nuclease of toxin-antitoxin system
VQLLLDTHILLWWLQDSRKLPGRSRALIAAAPAVYVSSVSIWETAIKVQARKLDLDLNELVANIARDGFQELIVSYKHAVQVGLLPSLHRDPFDRMLVAQAICGPMKLLTADRVLADYSELVEIV